VKVRWFITVRASKIAIDQKQDPQLLRHQVASEARSILNDDGANPIAFDPGEQLGEAWPGFYGVGTTHGGIVELTDKLMPGSSGERADGVALALIRVLVGPNIGRASSAWGSAQP
jgi:hypothetical protein